MPATARLKNQPESNNDSQMAGMPAIWLSLFDAGWFFSLAVAGTYYYVTAKKK